MNKIIAIFAVISMSYSTLVLSMTAEEKGLSIAQEVDNRDIGWKGATTKMKMVLENRQGDQSSRDVRVKFLEVKGDGDKGLTIFDSPADVKGTAFLSFSHSIDPDDQWLYMPSLKRVKRINSSNKSGPFMGSQFAYEDLSSFEVDKYSYKYIRDEKLGDIDSFVIENYPLYEYSGYSKQVAWIDKTRYIPIKIEYFDRKNSLLKTLILSNYTQYDNKYWRALEQRMVNHQNGKTTLLSFNEYKLNSGLKDSDFNRNSLKRSR